LDFVAALSGGRPFEEAEQSSATNGAALRVDGGVLLSAV
jgi:ADP-ribosylglycohydrolase